MKNIKKKKDLYLKRILFGSDFSVNLFKLESYTQYYNIFDNCPFTDFEIDLLASQNPIEFIGLLQN